MKKSLHAFTALLASTTLTLSASALPMRNAPPTITPVAGEHATRVVATQNLAPAANTVTPVSAAAVPTAPAASIAAGLPGAVTVAPEAAAATPRRETSPEAWPSANAEEVANFAIAGRSLYKPILDAEISQVQGLVAEGAVLTPEEMRRRLSDLPSTNPEREKYMVDLFALAGAKPEEIVLQDVGRDRHNIMVVKKGKTDRVIVVGGHHDKVWAGRGSIDNGTGATAVANLYQYFRDVETEATMVFIAFAREEEGLVGSASYVKSLTQELRSKIDAMINLDTLAVDGSYVWKNRGKGTPALLDRVVKASQESNHPLTPEPLSGGDADSTSFRRARIPAITIFGASQAVIFDIIHTDRDTMDRFNLDHYVNTYMAVLESMRALDREKLGHVEPGDI